jgi:hypothetical protein
VIELDNGAMLSANNITRITTTADEPATTVDDTGANKAAETSRLRAKSTATPAWLERLLNPRARSTTTVRN